MGGAQGFLLRELDSHFHVQSRSLPPYALRPSADGPEKSRHSAHVTECRDCSGAGADDLQAHGAALQRYDSVFCTVIVDS